MLEEKDLQTLIKTFTNRVQELEFTVRMRDYTIEDLKSRIKELEETKDRKEAE